MLLLRFLFSLPHRKGFQLLSHLSALSVLPAPLFSISSISRLNSSNFVFAFVVSQSGKQRASGSDFGYSLANQACVFQTQTWSLSAVNFSSFIGVIQGLAFTFRVLALLLRRCMIPFSLSFRNFRSPVPCSFYYSGLFSEANQNNFAASFKFPFSFLQCFNFFLGNSNYWFNRGSWLN